jgi:hypothetical protein
VYATGRFDPVDNLSEDKDGSTLHTALDDATGVGVRSNYTPGGSFTC